MRTLFSNPYFNASFWSWFTAQALKVILTLIKDLSSAICFKMYFDSLEYAVSIIFSLIIMYDASGVRRAVGKQAMILNQMIKDRQQNKQIEEKQLKELVGHTPIEVFAGAILGILIANLLI